MIQSINRSFRTVIEPIIYDFKLSHKSKILLLGSCFTENIGRKLEQLKFIVDNNPFGILYNPISVLNGLEIVSNKYFFKEEDLFFHNELWHSFNHHGRFSGPDKDNVLKGINERIEHSSSELLNTDFIFITFGTAWVYEYLQTNKNVANCHKVPNKEFRKYLPDLSVLTDQYVEFFKRLFSLNPKLKIIFTLSPVRHLKDGFSENFLSKSILRVLIDTIMKQLQSVYYFPAFEILNDDLRDYRFYNQDMIHPSDEAAEYIFDYFSNCFFCEETKQINKDISGILKSAEHRPFNEDTVEYKKFVKKNIETIKKFSKKYPFINLDDALSIFLNKA